MKFCVGLGRRSASSFSTENTAVTICDWHFSIGVADATASLKRRCPRTLNRQMVRCDSQTIDAARIKIRWASTGDRACDQARPAGSSDFRTSSPAITAGKCPVLNVDAIVSIHSPISIRRLGEKAGEPQSLHDSSGTMRFQPIQSFRMWIIILTGTIVASRIKKSLAQHRKSGLRSGPPS
jgi:hypothetical protein